MDKFYSESYFRDFFNRMPLYEQQVFSPIAGLDAKFDVFLSYNISDVCVVKGIFYYLTTQIGLKVYLDCIVDFDMDRSATNKSSAQRIQARLKNSRSLIYAQSQSAGHSNWMPWELGVVDGSTGKCMIMPVTSDAKPVSPQREYLLLYPYIKLSDSDNSMKVILDTHQLYGKDVVEYIRKM